MKILLFSFLFFPTIAMAQLSGYLSSNYGYHGNPLYNYAQSSDQVSQSYVELHHTSDFDNSSLDIGYTGGLMLFNQFAERNYYEHSLAGRWNLITREPKEGTEDADSTGAYLASELKFTARHDRSAFEVYDNSSGGLNVAYRTTTGDAMFMRFTNKAEYRSYKLIGELSNITDILSVSLGSRTHDKMYFEVLASAGVKHYTMTLSDTSTYETITPTSTGTGTGTGTGLGNGHGKGIGNGNGSGNSGGNSGTAPGFLKKQHLYVTPESDNSWQYTVAAIITKQWNENSASLGFTYRYNPTTNIRYVAQYVNTSALSEDIYNDHFAYEGPEAIARFAHLFPLRISSALQLQWASRTYSGPALTLDGTEIGSRRKDTALGFEVTVTKAFTIFDGVDLEINVTANAVRNQSNDEYNNYSASAVALGAAIGF